MESYCCCNDTETSGKGTACLVLCIQPPQTCTLCSGACQHPAAVPALLLITSTREVRIERQLWKVATKCMSNIHFLVIQYFHFSESPPPHQDICNYRFPLRFSHGQQSSQSHYLNRASHSTVCRSLKFFFCLLVLSCIYFVHNYFSLLQ